MTEIKRILVPTDFSEPADTALTYAIDLAARLGASVSLIHVFDDPFANGVYTGEYIPIPAETRAEIIADLRRKLAEAVASRGHSEVTSELLIGSTARTIVDGAADRNIDLIVMGTHGRGGVAHMLLGSVAERVVRTASCPVLTIRSKTAPANR